MYEFARARYGDSKLKCLLSDKVEVLITRSTTNLLFLNSKISFRLSIDKCVDMNRNLGINKERWRKVLTGKSYEELILNESTLGDPKYLQIRSSLHDSKTWIKIGGKCENIEIDLPTKSIWDSLLSFVGLESLSKPKENYSLRELSYTTRDITTSYARFSINTRSQIQFAFALREYYQGSIENQLEKLRKNENIEDPVVIFHKDDSILFSIKDSSEHIQLEVLVAPKFGALLKRVR